MSGFIRELVKAVAAEEALPDGGRPYRPYYHMLFFTQAAAGECADWLEHPAGHGENLRLGHRDQNLWRFFLLLCGAREGDVISALQDFVLVPRFGQYAHSQRYLAIEADHWSAKLMGWQPNRWNPHCNAGSKAHLDEKEPEFLELQEVLWRHFNKLRAANGQCNDDFVAELEHDFLECVEPLRA